MWVRASGDVLENVYLLNTAVSSHFLVCGEHMALVDSSVAALQEEFAGELASYIGEGETLSYLMLTHAHFDHVGGVPALRKLYPDLKLVASPEAAEQLGKEEVIESIVEDNKKLALALGRELPDYDWAEALKVEKVVGDGDGIDLGYGVEVKVIATPGHTVDSTSYFALPDGALQGGEAIGGYHGRGQGTPCFTYNYEDYLDSLSKLTSLEINALCLSHAGALRGELARKFLAEARQNAEQFVSSVRERIEQGELVEEISASIITDWKTQGISPEGPFVDALEQTTAQMVSLAASVGS